MCRYIAKQNARQSSLKKMADGENNLFPPFHEENLKPFGHKTFLEWFLKATQCFSLIGPTVWEEFGDTEIEGYTNYSRDCAIG